MDDDYESKSDQIRDLSSLPDDDLIDHLSNAHGSLAAAAPGLLPHIQNTAFRAIKFLGSKLPPPGTPLLEDQDPITSPFQKKSFLDYHKIVNDPVSVLDHVKDGTLNSRHLEALSSVYPDLHDEMKKQMTEGLIDSKAKDKMIPYGLRKSISAFMGQPLDSTLTPASAQTILHANAGAIAQTQQKQGRPEKQSSATLKQINQVTELTATDSQRREMDKRT
jgi:hypothetical protein